MAEYIDREKLLRDINHYHLSDGKFQHWVEVQQAADVAPVVHGRWEVSTDEWLGTDVYTCSKCREDYVLVEGTPKENLWHYCPNCGAQMHEDDFCSYGERKEDKAEWKVKILQSCHMLLGL